MEILSDIPVSLDTGKVLERMNIRKKREDIGKGIQELIEVVLPIARPKVVYQVSYVDNKTEDSVEVDGVRLTSRVLRDNLDEVGRVFPFVATCGRELDEIDIPADEFMKCYYLDQIKEMVLELAMSYLEEHLTRKYELGQISEMEPGSLESWPITQQKELFSIFGNVEDAIGVRLTDKCLMIPVKSVSGVHFPTEIKFESCQLCPMERCIGRKSPYNPDLARKYSEEVAG
jgi:hypothetical protein